MQYFVYFSLSLSLSPAPACISNVKINDGLPFFFVGGGEGGWEVRGKSILDW